jgi:peptidoglycan/LPS O-acetylase OafA/YrhL
MLSSTGSPPDHSRRSSLRVRIGSAILAAIILAYLLVISISRFHDASSTRDYLVLGFLWLLAIGALLLLARAWRTTIQKTES